MTEILVDTTRFKEIEAKLGAMTVEEEMDLANRYTNYEFASQISGAQFVNLVNFINNLLKKHESRRQV